MKKIKIGINGSFIRKPDSGMGQVSLNFLKNLSLRLDKGEFKQFEFVVYLEEKLQKPLSEKIKLRVLKSDFYRRDDLVRKIIWEKILLRKAVVQDRVEIFLSLYQSVTVLPKRVTHLMLVHDVVPKVFSQYLNNFRKKIYYNLVDRAIKRATQLLTVSRSSAKEIGRVYGLNERKIKVCLIDADQIFSEKLKEKQLNEVLNKFKLKRDWYIFYVGGFDVRKNVAELIEAYGRLCVSLKEKDLNLDYPKLVLAGTYHEHLRPLIEDIPAKIVEVTEKYGLSKKQIKLIGFVKQADLPAVYAGARVFCYPSLYEGFGLPVLEAMKMGTAVVCSDTTSLPEVAGDAASFFTPGDASILAATLEELVIDKRKVDKLAILAKKRSEVFSWDKFTDQIIEEIKNGNKS